MIGCRLVLFLLWYIYPEKTVPILTWELCPFDPEAPFRENLHESETQGGHTLWRQYKEAGMSLSSEKNCEAASCQGFLSFLYFLFPVAPYWQQMDYSLVLFLYILSHNAFSFYFSIFLIPLQYLFSPSKSPGFSFLSLYVLSSQYLFFLCKIFSTLLIYEKRQMMKLWEQSLIPQRERNFISSYYQIYFFVPIFTHDEAIQQYNLI